MVKEAANAGTNAIKFQTYKAEKIASKYSPAYWDTTKESTKSQYDLLKKYGIKAELTGCPALLNLKSLKEDVAFVRKGEIKKIAVTIPYLSVGPFLSRRPFLSVKSFLLTLYFLFILKIKFNKKELGLIFQHGYPNLVTKIMRRLASMFGMKTYDFVGKNLDSPELRKYDICIGPRLHSHIYFLSLNKPSFLLDIDRRTEGFLKTIKTPSDSYTFSGIKNLVNMLSDRIAENNFEKFNNVSIEITKLYIVMKKFLDKIILFYEKRSAL